MEKRKPKLVKASLASILGISLMAPSHGIVSADTYTANDKDSNIYEKTTSEEFLSDVLNGENSVDPSVDSLLEETPQENEYANEDNVSQGEIIDESTGDSIYEVEESVSNDQSFNENETLELSENSSVNDSVIDEDMSLQLTSMVDFGAPEIIDVYTTKSEYAPGQNVIVKFLISSEEQIEHLSAVFRNQGSSGPSILSEHAGNIREVSDGVFEAQITMSLPNEMANTTYSFNDIYLEGMNSDEIHYTSEAFNISFRVVNEFEVDSVPPELVEIYTDKEEYAPGEIVTLTVMSTDESEVREFYARFENQSGEGPADLSEMTGDYSEILLGGIYVGEIKFQLPDSISDTTYILQDVKLTDGFYNNKWYTNDSGEFEVSFDIVNDKDNSILEEVYLDKEVYIPGETVKLTILSSSLSQIQHYYAQFRNQGSAGPLNLSNNTSEVSLNDNGLYMGEVTFVLPSTMDDATYSLNAIRVRDNANNEKWYRSNSDSFDVSFRVMNEIEETVEEDTNLNYVNNFTVIDDVTGKEITSFTLLGQSYSNRLNDRISSFNRDYNLELEIVGEQLTSKSISSSTINNQTISKTTSEITIFVFNHSDNELEDILPPFVPEDTLYDDVTSENAYRKINIVHGDKNLYNTQYIGRETVDDSIRSAMAGLDNTYPGSYYFNGVEVSNGFTTIVSGDGGFIGPLLDIIISVEKYTVEEEPVDEEPVDEEPVDEEPVEEEPVDEEPVEEEPVDEEPVDEEPAEEEPVEEEPVEEEPVDEEPAEEEPVKEEPIDDNSDHTLTILEDMNTGITVSSEYGELEGLQLVVEILGSSDRISAPHDRYNIELLDMNGKKYTLKNPVTVSIPVNGEVSNLYYLIDSLVDVPFNIVENDAVFTAESFSEYAVVYSDLVHDDLNSENESEDNVVVPVDNNLTEEISKEILTDNSVAGEANHSVVASDEIDAKQSEQELLPNTGISAINVGLPVAVLALVGITVVFFTRRKLN